MHICKGWCRNEKERGGVKFPYTKGYKRCSPCNKIYKTDDVRCFCCSSKLRTGAQANIYRQIRTAPCVRFE